MIAVGLRHEDYGDRREYILVGLVCGIHAADVPSIFMAKPSFKFMRNSFTVPRATPCPRSAIIFALIARAPVLSVALKQRDVPNIGGFKNA